MMADFVERPEDCLMASRLATQAHSERLAGWMSASAPLSQNSAHRLQPARAPQGPGLPVLQLVQPGLKWHAPLELVEKTDS
jgi:hypothetical protein